MKQGYLVCTHMYEGNLYNKTINFTSSRSQTPYPISNKLLSYRGFLKNIKITLQPN